MIINFLKLEFDSDALKLLSERVNSTALKNYFFFLRDTTAFAVVFYYVANLNLVRYLNDQSSSVNF